MSEPDPVDVMAEFLSNKSTNPGHREVTQNGVLKLRFDSVADSIEAFSMICLHAFGVSAQKISKHASH